MPAAPLVFVGTATSDTIVLVDRYPAADERVVVDDVVHAGGGPAATAAVTAARLGHPVAFVGAVGDDEIGDAIVAGLDREGVDTTGVARRPGGRSATSVVVVARDTATRAILHRPADAVELSATGWGIVGGAEWLHVDQVGWPLVAEWWRSRRDRPRLSIDAGNPLELTLAGVDLYVPTVTALRRRYGDRTPEQLVDAAVTDGAALVVATDGAGGAWLRRAADAAVLHVPAFGADVRSTLGAGDVFHGALLAALHRGLPARAAVVYASAVAALSCRGLDGRSAIPDHAATETFLRDQEDAA